MAAGYPRLGLLVRSVERERGRSVGLGRRVVVAVCTAGMHDGLRRHSWQMQNSRSFCTGHDGMHPVGAVLGKRHFEMIFVEGSPVPAVLEVQ